MPDLVIFGTGHSAGVAKVYLDRHSEHRVVGFTVDPQYATEERLYNLPIVPWDRLEEVFPPDRVELLGPISYARMNEFRRDRYREGKARHYRFASFIHPNCQIYTQDIGEHCFIMDANVIEPFAKIGDNVIIWGGTRIGHHAVIGDHCFISGQVGIGALTRIGERCFLGIRVATRPDVTIGEACLVGFGVDVQQDLPPGSVVVNDAHNRIAPFPSSRAHRLL